MTATLEVAYNLSGAWITLTGGQYQYPTVTAGIDLPQPGALGFGGAASSTCEVVTKDDVPIVADALLRVRFGYDGSNVQVFRGVVETVEKDHDSGSQTVKASGALAQLSTTRLFSPLFERRRAATATTAASIEDTTNAYYAGGPINYSFWNAGGRPSAQSASYPTAPWYYACDEAVIAPRYAWFAGEDSAAETNNLCQVVGGVIFQRLDGTVVYKHPLNLAGGTPLLTFSTTGPNSASVQTIRALKPQSIAAFAERLDIPVTPRRVEREQLLKDMTPKELIAAGETKTYTLTLDQPARTILYTTAPYLPQQCFVLRYQNGVAVPYNAANFTHTTSASAAAITISITNTHATAPFSVEKLSVWGQPLMPNPAQSVKVGTAATTARARTQNASPLIQDKSHAEQLGNLQLLLGSARTLYTFQAPYRTGLDVGDVTTLHAPRYGSDRTILLLKVSINAHVCDWTAVDVTDLPRLSDYYVVSTTPQTTAKKVGY